MLTRAGCLLPPASLSPPPAPPGFLWFSPLALHHLILFFLNFSPPPPGFILTYLIVRAFLAAHGIVRLHRDLRTLQSQLEGSCSLTRDRARGPPVLGVQSLGLWTTRKVPRSFFRMKKGGHSSLSTSSVSWPRLRPQPGLAQRLPPPRSLRPS